MYSLRSYPIGSRKVLIKKKTLSIDTSVTLAQNKIVYSQYSRPSGVSIRPKLPSVPPVPGTTFLQQKTFQSSVLTRNQIKQVDDNECRAKWMEYYLTRLRFLKVLTRCGFNFRNDYQVNQRKYLCCASRDEGAIPALKILDQSSRKRQRTI